LIFSFNKYKSNYVPTGAIIYDLLFMIYDLIY